jgi:RNA polymerase sigma-70 factor (ECF subfamily)
MVTVRYWAAAKQAAGVAEEVLTAGTLAEMLAAVLARHPAAPALEGILARSSFLIDGEQAGTRQGGTGAQVPKGKVSDESLVRELYAEHAAPLLRYALRMTDGDRQRAEDIVQETLFRAWQHPEAIAERPARPWLFAVARNLAVDAHRARKARPQEVGEGALELVPVPDEADRVLESWAVADALATLRPEHRRVLLETYYLGRSVAEASVVLGIPAGTVKSRAFYALRALKLALEERGLAP